MSDLPCERGITVQKIAKPPFFAFSKFLQRLIVLSLLVFQTEQSLSIF